MDQNAQPPQGDGVHETTDEQRSNLQTSQPDAPVETPPADDVAPDADEPGDDLPDELAGHRDDDADLVPDEVDQRPDADAGADQA